MEDIINGAGTKATRPTEKLDYPLVFGRGKGSEGARKQHTIVCVQMERWRGSVFIGGFFRWGWGGYRCVIFFLISFLLPYTFGVSNW